MQCGYIKKLSLMRISPIHLGAAAAFDGSIFGGSGGDCLSSVRGARSDQRDMRQQRVHISRMSPTEDAKELLKTKRSKR